MIRKKRNKRVCYITFFSKIMCFDTTEFLGLVVLVIFVAHESIAAFIVMQPTRRYKKLLNEVKEVNAQMEITRTQINQLQPLLDLNEVRKGKYEDRNNIY